MRRSVATSFRCFAFTFAAVCVMWFGIPLLAQTCPDLPFDEEWPIAPAPDKIAATCDEACPEPHFSWTISGFSYAIDPSGTPIDVVYAKCVNKLDGTTKYVNIPSDFFDCWRCEGYGGCAGDACPQGQLCVQQPAVGGSDCRRYVCNDPRYQPVENGYDENGKILVVCRLKPEETCEPPTCTPATVTLAGPTKIQPGATCEWSAAATAPGCASGTYIYHWFAANQWVGGGQSYTGGKPSGVLNGYPWKLRVEVVLQDGTPAGSKEITVSESSTAPVCFY